MILYFLRISRVADYFYDFISAFYANRKPWHVRNNNNKIMKIKMQDKTIEVALDVNMIPFSTLLTILLHRIQNPQILYYLYIILSFDSNSENKNYWLKGNNTDWQIDQGSLSVKLLLPFLKMHREFCCWALDLRWNFYIVTAYHLA